MLMQPETSLSTSRAQGAVLSRVLTLLMLYKGYFLPRLQNAKKLENDHAMLVFIGKLLLSNIK